MVASLVLSCAAIEAFAESQMLYIADPAMNMIHGQRLDAQTTDTLVTISGTATIVADSVAHLSDREIAFVPNGERIVALLDLQTRTISTLAEQPGSGLIEVGAGLDENDVVWSTWDRNGGAETRRLYRARRTGATWTTTGFPIASQPAALFAVGPDSVAFVNISGQLYLQREGAAEAQLLNTLSRSSIARGPNREILHFVPGSTTIPATIFDSEGNPLSNDPVLGSPLLGRGPQAIEWRASAPPLAGVTRSLGELLTVDTLDTTATVAVAHTTRDENGSVIPERDITGASTLRRVSPTRWQFYNDAGGLQVIDTTTRRAEYQLQYSAGTGPEFSAINAMAAGPDHNLYVLDSDRRLFRVDPRTGARELLKTFEDAVFLDFIHVRADGTIVLVQEKLDHVLVSGSAVEVWNWRLVNLRRQGGELVAEYGTFTERPKPPIVYDFRAIEDGVRVLWKGERLTRLGDLTLAGARDVPTVKTATSGAVTIADRTLISSVVFPESSVPVQAVSLKWTFPNGTRLEFNDKPVEVRLRAPSGRVTSFPAWDSLEFLSPTGAPYIRDYHGFMRATNGLATPEASGGTWQVECIFGSNVAPAAMSSLAFLYGIPIAAQLDPLFRSTVLVEPQDGSTSTMLFAGFPATLRRFDVATGATESASLQGDERLNRLRDAISVGETVYASPSEAFLVWRIDPATGASRPIVAHRPAGLNARLVGRNGSSFLKLAVAPAPEFFAAAGWIVN